MDKLLQQILKNYGDDVTAMPDDVRAYYWCFRCADHAEAVRAMRNNIIPAFRTSPSFGKLEIAEAIAAFDARFPQEIKA